IPISDHFSCGTGLLCPLFPASPPTIKCVRKRGDKSYIGWSQQLYGQVLQAILLLTAYVTPPPILGRTPYVIIPATSHTSCKHSLSGQSCLLVRAYRPLAGGIDAMSTVTADQIDVHVVLALKCPHDASVAAISINHGP
ncbi:unnamed protein product, partial [Laminaria digitata]